MTTRDLRDRRVVYHTVMAHWGPGKVIKHQYRDAFGFVKKKQWLIEFEHTPNLQGNHRVWCAPSELRKTPNREKLAMLASLKAQRHDRHQP